MWCGVEKVWDRGVESVGWWVDKLVEDSAVNQTANKYNLVRFTALFSALI
jgi:hypothetical protein